MTIIKNIKTDYGAVGDGQKLTVAITIAHNSGPSNTLTAGSSIFSSGDSGKYFAFTTPDLNIDDSGIRYVGIMTYVNATTITLASLYRITDSGHTSTSQYTGTAMSGSSQTIEWGTDDAPKFRTFHAAYNTQTDIQLNCPAGRYCFITGVSASWPGDSSSVCFFGIGLHVLSSDGNSTLVSPQAVFTDLLGGGSEPYFGSTRTSYVNDTASDTYFGEIATVAAGSSTVQLLTLADYSKFTVGKYVLIAGFEAQGFGFPINPQFFEYPKITAINTGTGVITLDTPLKHSYNQNWVDWSDSPFPNGVSGKPRIYVANENQITGGTRSGEGIWDRVQIYEGIGFEFSPPSSSGTFNQFTGRDVTITGGYSRGGQVPICSMCQDYVVDGHDMSIAQISEIDKVTVNATLKNLTIKGWTCQSPSPEVFILDNVHVTQRVSGTGKSVIFRNGCVIDVDSILIGPNSYGAASNTESFIASDSTFNTRIEIGGVIENDVQGVGAYTISGGVISRVTGAGSGGPPQWAAPGAWVFPAGGTPGHAYGPAFRILNMTESGGSLHITTSLTGGWPTGAYSIQTAAAPQMTFTNCIGTSEEAKSWSSCEALKPKNSRWNRRYQGNIGTSFSATPILVFGKVVSISFTNNAISTGTFSLGTGTSNGSPFVIQTSNAASVSWPLVIDLTLTGPRTITYNSGTNSFSYSGSVGSDAITMPGSGALWLADDQMFPSMVGANSSADITVTMVTDQGIVADAVIGGHVYRSIEIHGGAYRAA